MARRRPRSAAYVSPHRLFLLIGGLTVVFLTALAHWAAGWAWPWAYLAAVNIVAVAFYAYDKHRATAGGLRVPERVLHLIAFVGGTPGAFAGQQLFRHKTAKGRFQLWFWMIFALQLGLAIGWWYARHHR